MKIRFIHETHEIMSICFANSETDLYADKHVRLETVFINIYLGIDLNTDSIVKSFDNFIVSFNPAHHINPLMAHMRISSEVGQGGQKFE